MKLTAERGGYQKQQPLVPEYEGERYGWPIEDLSMPVILLISDARTMAFFLDMPAIPQLRTVLPVIQLLQAFGTGKILK